MKLVLTGDLDAFNFLYSSKVHIRKKKLYTATLLEVKFKHRHRETVLFAAVGHTKVEISINLMGILQKYYISSIILMGNCGLIKSDIGDIGDIAISSQVYQYDVDFSAIGYPRAVLPSNGQSTFVKANSELIKSARNAARHLSLTSHTGIYGSADQFLADKEFAKYLKYKFNTMFADCESAAVSEIARTFGINMVVVKGISNFANKHAGKDYEKWEEEADELSGQVVLEMLDWQ